MKDKPPVSSSQRPSEPTLVFQLGSYPEFRVESQDSYEALVLARIARRLLPKAMRCWKRWSQ